MKRALVTGSAGFIGSHLTEALLADGWEVIGVDCFLDSYETAPRRAVAAMLATRRGCWMVEADLLTADLGSLLEGVDAVFHLAARPGVRTSWADFEAYVGPNITATQRLLEAMVGGDARLVFASSSSVYGQADTFPTPETVPLRPISPYGVTKVAGERLAAAYASERGVDVRSLRFFTVYGPRQRSDMAFHRWISAALATTPVPVFGDGSAQRDYTYVGDVVTAILSAVDLPSGTVANVAGGNVASISDVLGFIGEILGEEVAIERLPKPPGDPARTGGDTALLRAAGWEPRWSLREGVAAEIEWLRQVRGTTP